MRILPQPLPLFRRDPSGRERLPTNTLSKHHRVQRWANFIAGYSVEFVEQCLQSRNPALDRIVDPFLGCGTTLVAAKNMGFKGDGFERHPVFFNLAQAKLGNYTEADLMVIRAGLLSASERLVWSDDAQTFLAKLFAAEALESIGRAAQTLQRFPARLQPLAIAFFLNACEASCQAKTDGIYKAPTSTKTTIPFPAAVEDVYAMLADDIATPWYTEHWTQQPTPSCFFKSSTDLSELASNTVAVCITSPPYLNNFDYAEMTRMHLYLLGWAVSWRDISTSLRNHLITNTTTALKGKRTEPYQQSCRAILPSALLVELDDIVSDLALEKKRRAGKKDYNYLVYPYYAEIKQVLSELFRVMRAGGEVHWVVADSALYGVHLKTHLHTAELMRTIGFDDVSIDFIRQRGHRWVLNKRDGAPEGLGEYYIRAKKGA